MKNIYKSAIMTSFFLCGFGLLGDVEPLPEFPVHFAVITNNPAAQAAATVETLKAEIEILNKYFRSSSGEAIVNFTFKSASFYSEIKDSVCAIAKLGDAAEEWRAPEYLSACTDAKLAHPNAVLFIVYDAWNKETKFAHIDSMGGYFKNRPFVLMDWERLGHKTQSPEEHEMGHAFGLAHVCVRGAKRNSSTNIMASHQDCPDSSGGLRDIGFDNAQVATIKQRIKIYQKSLKL